MAIDLLKDERACDTFMRRLYGIMAVIDSLDTSLENNEWSSDDLMYLHFDQDKAILRDFLDRPSLRETFVQLYPRHAHLVDAAEDLCDALDDLHSVRQELIAPHLRADRRDVQREIIEENGVETIDDRAYHDGLTIAQRRAYESQLTPKGFMRLGADEKQRLRRGISEHVRERVTTRRVQ